MKAEQMKKMVGAMALGVVLAAGSVTAAEAAPTSFTVTAKVSKTSSAVGAKIKVTGKVAGQSAKKLKGKKVTVQRKYATGAWKKVGTARITSKRTYSLSVKLTAGGNTSFRAVKAKSGKVRSGTSAARTLSVFKTFDLTTSPIFAVEIGSRNSPVVMNKKSYPRAFQSLNQLVVFVDARSCSTVSGVTGFLDRQKSQIQPTAVQETQIVQLDATNAVVGESVFTTTLNQVAKRTVAVKPATRRLAIIGAVSSGGSAVFALPTLRCNRNTLAPTYENEIAL